MDDVIRKFALQNAVAHGGKADKGAVMSRVLGERPDLRARSKEVAVAVDVVLREVNALPVEEQRRLLEALAPELLIEKKSERPLGLPELAGATKGKVVMRFAPGPSGPLHIGHARAAVLNDEYCRRYAGKYILRLEDTDPARVMLEAYDMIKGDMAWLGCAVHEVVIQSDRFDRYYEVARRLLELGKAYVCTDKPDVWRKLKEAKRPCTHRGLPSEKNLEAFEAMLAGAYKPEGAAVIGMTDLEHPNPAIRDFPLLRIEDTPHPRTGRKYRVYPLMNFSVSVDDHDLGLTHVLRGKDHINNTLRQEYLFTYLGWKMPVYIHYGRVQVEGLELSTSKIGAGISRGDFTGWDDPRLATLRALKRRGYRPESIREYWVDASVKEVDVDFSWKTLNAIDKKRADPEANRLFYVEDPSSMALEIPKDLEAHPARLPDRPDAGRRELKVVRDARGTAHVWLPAADVGRLKAGDSFRLKDLGNFHVSGPAKASYAGNELVQAKTAPILHWLPADPEQTTEGRIHYPDGRRGSGKMERESVLQDGRVVQFERVGFARIEVGVSPSAEVDAFFLYR